MIFAEAAVQSAQQYYDYLTKKDKGIVSFRVHRITKINEPGILAYWLDLDRTPATDHLQVRIRGQIYEDNQIRVVVVDKINKRIRRRIC